MTVLTCFCALDVFTSLFLTTLEQWRNSRVFLPPGPYLASPARILNIFSIVNLPKIMSWPSRDPCFAVVCGCFLLIVFTIALGVNQIIKTVNEPPPPPTRNPRYWRPRTTTTERPVDSLKLKFVDSEHSEKILGKLIIGNGKKWNLVGGDTFGEFNAVPVTKYPPTPTSSTMKTSTLNMADIMAGAGIHNIY